MLLTDEPRPPVYRKVFPGALLAENLLLIIQIPERGYTVVARIEQIRGQNKKDLIIQRRCPVRYDLNFILNILKTTVRALEKKIDRRYAVQFDRTAVQQMHKIRIAALQRRYEFQPTILDMRKQFPEIVDPDEFITCLKCQETLQKPDSVQSFGAGQMHVLIFPV